jgi:hypothetical protein
MPRVGEPLGPGGMYCPERACNMLCTSSLVCERRGMISAQTKVRTLRRAEVPPGTVGRLVCRMSSMAFTLN